MKYTLEGFSQKSALKITKELKSGDGTKILKLDAIDLILLRWFVDFYPNMKKKIVNQDVFAWVNYSTVVDDLPLLAIKKKTISERFKKMCDLEILTHYFDKQGGSFSYYGFGSNYNKLISTGKHSSSEVTDDVDGDPLSVETDTPIRSNGNPLSVQTDTPIRSDGYPLSVQTETKDSSINNSSINNSSTNPSPITIANEKHREENSTNIKRVKGETENENKLSNVSNENPKASDPKNLEKQKIIQYINKATDNEDIKNKIFCILRIRKDNGDPNTFEFVRTLIDRLNRFSNNSDTNKINLLDYSIEHSYDTVYDVLDYINLSSSHV